MTNAAGWDCPRAQICDGSSCVALPCDTAADCPEGNRTCLLGYDTCGSKECNTGNSVVDQCSSALCDATTFTCLSQCASDEECASAGVDMTCQNDICRPRQRLAGTRDGSTLTGRPIWGRPPMTAAWAVIWALYRKVWAVHRVLAITTVRRWAQVRFVNP